MIENEIEEFVTKSIDQIRAASPKDCVLTGEINFEVSLVTSKEKDGRIGISLAGVGGKSSVQQVHRVRFSITDVKSFDNNMQLLKKTLRKVLPEFSKLDELEHDTQKVAENG